MYVKEIKKKLYKCALNAKIGFYPVGKVIFHIKFDLNYRKML